MKDLKLNLIIEAVERATAPLRKVGEALTGVGERAEKVERAFHKLGAAELIGGAFFTGAVLEAGRGIFELTQHTAEFGVEALHASQKAAMSVEQIQKLQFAAKMLDVDSDSLGETMFRFNQHVISAATGSKREEKALRAMGVEIKGAHGQLKPLYELFLEFSDAFSRMDARVANFAAFTMLGRGGVRSIPLLKQGREGLLAFGEQAERMGVIMDDETAEKAEGFMQHMKLVGQAVDGIKMRLGIQLMPVMDAFLVKLTTMIVKLQPEAIQRFSGELGHLIDRLPQILPRLERAAELAARLADRLLRLSDNTKLVKGVLIALATVIALQVTLAFFQMAFTVAKGAAAFVEFIGVITSLIELSAGVKTFAGAMALLDIALDANPIGVIVLAIGALIAVIALVGAAVYQIYQHWGGLVSWFAGLWKSITSLFTNAWKALSDMTPDWLKALLKLSATPITLAIQGIESFTAPARAAITAHHAPRLAPATSAAQERRPSAGGAPHAATAAHAPGDQPWAPLSAAKTPAPSDSQAQLTPAKAYVHVHVTSDGKVQVKSMSSDPGTVLDVSRGVMPA